MGQVGVAVFAFALAVPFVGADHAQPAHPNSVIESTDGPNSDPDAFSGLSTPTSGGAPARVRELSRGEGLTVVETISLAPDQRESVPEEGGPPPQMAALSSAVVVVASWYGPGFYGNRTACGLMYSAEVLGVAHRTLPCGTVLTLTYGDRSVAVTVIDRGPYIGGRTLDLSRATRVALGCPDLCTLSMRLAP